MSCFCRIGATCYAKQVRATTYAGYPERAMGLFQAVLELNLGRMADHDASTLPQDALYEVFGAWWDAEHARVGDDSESYTGFYIGAAPKEAEPLIYLDEPETSEVNEEVPQENIDMVQWQRKEREMAQVSEPQRIKNDTEDPVDPFSFVFFDDIRAGLFEGSSTESVVRIADAFLAYLGLPEHWFMSSLQFGTPATEFCSQRPNLYADQDHLYLPRSMWPFLDTPSDTNTIGQHCAAQRLMLTPDILFPRTDKDPRGPWFVLLRALPARAAAQAERVLAHLAIRFTAAGEEELAKQIVLPHAMLCATAGAPKSARRILRSALQRQQDSVFLWYAYAQLELSTWGNVEAVRKVLLQVLGLLGQATQNPSNLYGAALLWALWAELEWVTGNTATCTRVLMAASAAKIKFSSKDALESTVYSQEPMPLRSTEKLQVLNTLRKRVDAASQDTGLGAMIIAPACTCLAIAEALFQEVEVGKELAAPASVFCDKLEKPKEEQVHVHLRASLQKFISMFQRTGSGKAFRPSEVRAIMTRLAVSTPPDSCHWQSFATQQQHSRIDNHVREKLAEYLISRGNRGAWLEILRWPSSLGRGWFDAELDWLLACYLDIRLASHLDSKRARKCIDHALASMRGSPLLWHFAIELEMHLVQNAATLSRTQQRRQTSEALQRAKAFVYQSIRHCPYDRGMFLFSHSSLPTCL